jgi:glycosyltransferase involved in cell wall biosynthesis
MTSGPLVSVVIPAYNAAETITEAIDSVLAQSMDDVEVIVVDDGSSDGTRQVVDQIADPRVRLIPQSNAGAPAARNTGIHASTGQWVAFLDSDDLWLPHKLETQLAALDAAPSVRAAQSSVYWVDGELHVRSVERCRRSRDGLLNILRFTNTPGASSTLIVDRLLLEELGGYDDSLTILEDWDLMIKLARFGNLVSIDEPLALYRIHPGNRSIDVDIHIEPGFKVLGRLFEDPDLPDEVRRRRREIYGRFYMMLAGGAFRVGRWGDWLKWTRRALRTDPRMVGPMALMPYRRVRRAAEGRMLADRRPTVANPR